MSTEDQEYGLWTTRLSMDYQIKYGLPDYLVKVLQEKLPPNNYNSEYDKVSLLAPADKELDSDAQQLPLRLEQNAARVADTSTKPAD